MRKKQKSFGDAVAVGAALAGAALGATAVMLSDKKNQDKIKKTIDEISHDAVELGKNIKKRAEKYTKNAKKDEKKTEEEVKKIVAKIPAKTATTPVKK